MGDKALVLKKLPPFDSVGSAWTYDYNLMGNKNTMVITCIKNDESVKDGIIHQNNMNQGSISYTNVEIKDNTIYYTKIKTVMDYDPDNPFISKYEKPLKIIKAPLYLGESWQDYDNVLDAKVKREVVGLENITVKAGTFSAVKIKVDYIKKNKNESFGYFEWWSEDVGIIKSSNMELELKKYEQSGSNTEKIVNENYDNLKQELSKEQLLALAMAGMYAEYNNGDHNSLLDRAPSEEGIEEMRKSLDEAWGVYNNYDLNETLLWLLETGHCKRYEMETKKNKSILAWDLCRLINLVRFGAYSEYIIEKDAWHWIMSAASYLKSAFKSWEELVESYMRGRHYWICLTDEIEWKEDEWENINDDEQEIFNNIFKNFLNKNEPGSLWIKNKWIYDPDGNKKGDELKKQILNDFNQKLYNNETSYFQKNKNFWHDFKKHKDKVEKSIDNKQHEQSSDIITSLVYNMIPGMAFLYGFNTDTKKYELFLSYAGDKNNMILAKYWKENSPKIKNWDFFSSKQPANIANFKLKIYDIEIDPKDLMVETKINKDNKKINITVYHPEFKNLNDNQRINITFILLDESLGEDTTEVRIGEIHTSNTELKNNPIAITKLKNYIDNVVEDNKWNPLLTPDQIWNSYSIKPVEKSEYSPREDIIAGSTMNINTVKNYMKYDLLKGTGSDYIFLMFSNDDFDTKTIVKQRAKIEDLLDDELRKNKQGFLIGGATGINNLYIDLIIFDKKNSIDTIKKTMNKNFGDIEGSIHYFPGIKQNEVFYF